MSKVIIIETEKVPNMNRYGYVCLTRLSAILQLFCGCLLHTGEDNRHVTNYLQHWSHHGVTEYILQCAVIKLSLSGDRHWLHR